MQKICYFFLPLWYHTAGKGGGVPAPMPHVALWFIAVAVYIPLNGAGSEIVRPSPDYNHACMTAAPLPGTRYYWLWCVYTSLVCWNGKTCAQIRAAFVLRLRAAVLFSAPKKCAGFEGVRASARVPVFLHGKTGLVQAITRLLVWRLALCACISCYGFCARPFPPRSVSRRQKGIALWPRVLGCHFPPSLPAP